ncbi:MAG: disulfide bond formation protein B [Methylomonas sp.]
MNFVKFSPRIAFILGFCGCVALLLVGAYMQFILGLEPCPLCISQRLAILATGLFFLLAAVHNQGRKIYAILTSLTAIGGACISARHIWIQHLPPDEVPECSPGLDYALKYLPLTDTVKLMLTGTGECAKVDWTMLGLSIPEWTLMAFLGLAGFAFLQYFNTYSSNKNW